MPRILQVLANPFIGGTETFAINLSVQLNNSGIANHILNLANESSPFTESCFRNQVPLSTLKGTWKSPFQIKKLVDTTIGTFRPDVVFSFGFRASILLRFALPHHLRKRHITGLRGLDSWRRAYHSYIDSATESRLAYFVAVSRAVLEQRRAREKTSPKKLLYIPNGIDTNHFRPCPNALPPRTALGLPEGRIFLTIANFREEKGHRFLLDAISRVKDFPDDIRFVWVGGGRDYEQLSRLVATTPYATKITLLPAVQDVREILGHASVFILPSREEGMPRALMEAMAMSIPVLATRVGGVPDLFQKEQPGYLVNYGDVEGLAYKLKELCDAKGQISSLGINARKVIVNHFDMRQIAEDYIKLFSLIADENIEEIEAFRLKSS